MPMQFFRSKTILEWSKSFTSWLFLITWWKGLLVRKEGSALCCIWRVTSFCVRPDWTQCIYSHSFNTCPFEMTNKTPYAEFDLHGSSLPFSESQRHVMSKEIRQAHVFFAKCQLISKCLFDIFNSSKNEWKNSP